MDAHQYPGMPEKGREYYQNTILKRMGKTYGEDREWYSMRLNAIKLNKTTTGQNIYMLMEEGLKRAKEIEKKWF